MSRASVIIQNRRVVIDYGSLTQTVKICTSANRAGKYEEVYRLGIEEPVPPGELSELPTLDDLHVWLEARNAVLEPIGRAPTRAPLDLVPFTDVDGEWVRAATLSVDQAMDELVERFLVDPYLHRVEHSLHAELFRLLKDRGPLNEETRLATGESVQLVHKEWPETLPRLVRGVPPRRGLFDLVVLSPPQLRAATLDQFRAGRIAAPIVIEVGLDYGFPHLEQDKVKLVTSKVAFPYLLHLSRIAVRDNGPAEELVEAPPENFRVAYAHHDPQTKTTRVKRVAESVVTVTPASALAKPAPTG